MAYHARMLPPSLERARYLNLATYRSSGQPVLTPIWFAPLKGRLYAFSDGNAGKVKRLRRSERARIAACDMRGGLRGPWIEARARVLRDPERIGEAYAALGAKYGWQIGVANLFARVSGRLARRAVLEIEPAAEPPPSS
jgi:PPOX class probable F420-dependent enzyme